MMALFLMAAMTTPNDIDAKTLRTWGKETLDVIRRDLYIPERKLYAEEMKDGKRSEQPAFNWGVGVMLSALAAAARVDPQMRPWLREYADASRVYWNVTGPVPGYDVLPGPKPVDRYYDDNAWMVMALVEAHETLGDVKYLQWAEETLKYVLSGEDEKLGGGIYWKEAEKTSKNTCSNGPSAAAALAVYSHLRKPEYLEAAKRLYAWTKKNLQDPADKLFWDNMNLKGEIEKTEWSYNTGLMLRSAVELYRETKNPAYAADAKEIEEASIAKWIDQDAGVIKDDGKFAHLLMEAWVRRAKVMPYAGGAWPTKTLPGIRFVREMTRDNAGMYGHRWERAVKERLPKPMLIDQASAARAFYVGAAALQGRVR